MADEAYWTYKSASPTPTLAEAIIAKAIPFNTTEQQWHSLSPGMRREVVRSYVKKNNP